MGQREDREDAWIAWRARQHGLERRDHVFDATDEPACAQLRLLLEIDLGDLGLELRALGRLEIDGECARDRARYEVASRQQLARARVEVIRPQEEAIIDADHAGRDAYLLAALADRSVDDDIDTERL